MPIKFNHLPDFINNLDDKVSQGLGTGAEKMANTASDKAPKDTGYLSEHIYVIDNGPLSKEVLADAPYAAPVELGPRFGAPQPYMLPAFDAEKDNVIEAIKEALS